MESNQRPPGSEPGVTTSSNCSASICFINDTQHMSGFARGFEPSRPASKAGGLPLADPQECPAGIEPASPGWKPGAFAARPRAHSCQRKERESNSQGLVARPLSRRLPSPVGLPFRFSQKSCGGRNRTCIKAINSRPPVPAQDPPHHSVRMAGFEPAISYSRGTRDARLPHTLK